MIKKFGSILLGGALVLGLAACGDEPKKSNGSTDTDQEDVSKEQDQAEETKNETFAVGDTAEFKDAKFTLKSVTTTDERNEFADTDPAAVIVIEYELENLSDNDLSYGMDITVYDADGNQMDTYPLENSMGALASGKKVQGVEAHGIEALGTIEIHYAPLVSFDKAAVFEVEVN